MFGESYKNINKTVYDKYLKEILPVYKNFVKQWNDEIEYAKKHQYPFMILMSCLFFLVSVFLFIPDDEPVLRFFMAPMFFIGGLGILASCFYVDKKGIERILKQRIMKPFCSCFEDLKWLKAENKEFNILKHIGLMKKIGLFYTDDMSHWTFDDIFKGSYKDIGFEFFECACLRIPFPYILTARLEFAGVIIKVDLNKNFKGRTIIRPRKLKGLKTDSNLKQINLEDIKFANQFKVLSSDEVESRYLITTSFMERLNNIKENFEISIDDISCAFVHKKLYIALYTKKDLFTIDTSLKTFLTYEDFLKLAKEILAIYNLIDYFKITEKTKI